MDDIVVVSGLPRSGTSLMMQALRAGGLELVSDGQREADESNPCGYMELEAVKALPRGDHSFLDHAQGQAVKIIHALLRHLPSTHRYRVVFMWRDLEEVVASQRKMLERDGRPGAAIPDAALAQVFGRQRDEAMAWLEAQPHMQACRVDYAAAIQDPTSAMREVAAFLELPLDTDAMACAVDPTLHREKTSSPPGEVG